MIVSGSDELEIYAAWKQNEYIVNEFTNPNMGSSTVYRINKTARDGNNVIYERNTDAATKILFDSQEPLSLDYYRIGYKYNGYSFVNYGYHTGIAKNFIQSGAANSKLSYNNVKIDGMVCLFAAPTNNINDIAALETLGDGFIEGEDKANFTQEAHYVTLYLGWEALRYDINIGLGTRWVYGAGEPKEIDNFGMNDANYRLRMGGSISAMNNNSVLANIQEEGNASVKFSIYFDEKFTTARYNGMYLNQMAVLMTGFTFMTLNTHYNSSYYVEGDINNTMVVKNGSIQNLTFNNTMYQSMYYQSAGAATNGNVYSLKEYINFEALSVNVNIDDEPYTFEKAIIVNNNTTFADGANTNTVTLFAGYQVNQYSVKVQNATASDIKGVYALVNSAGYPGNIQNFANYDTKTSKFYTNQYVIAIPNMQGAGGYLSKVELEYLNEADNAKYKLELDLAFNSADRAIKFNTFKLYKFVSGSYEQIIEGLLDAGLRDYVIVYDNSHAVYNYTQQLAADEQPRTTGRIALDYAFNSLRIRSYEYGKDEQVIKFANENQSNAKYTDYADDTFFTVLEFENIKTALDITCFYDVQRFNVNIQLTFGDQITDSGVGEDIVVEYGQILQDITNQWQAKVSGLDIEGWYYKIKGGDGSTTFAPVTPTMMLGMVNQDYELACNFIDDQDASSAKTKKVLFYHWDIASDKYIAYNKNSEYILQGRQYNYDVLQEKYIEHKLGYQYDPNNGWYWEADSNNGENFIVNQTGMKDGDTLNYGRLKKIPTISSWYPDSQFIGYVMLDTDLLWTEDGATDTNGNGKIDVNERKMGYINEQCGTNYTYISQFLEEDFYFKVINYYWNEGKTIPYVDVVAVGMKTTSGEDLIITGLNLLSTVTKIEGTVFAVQAYAQFSFSVEDKEQFTYNNATEQLTIKTQDYLDTVTFFELSGNKVVFYDKESYSIQMVALTQTEYDEYLSLKGTTPVSALNGVVERIRANGGAGRIKTIKDTTPSPDNTPEADITINLKENEYLFLFYYKDSDAINSTKTNNSMIDIIAVCDTFITVADKGAGKELEFYPTTNDVRFNPSAVTVTSSNVNGVIITTADINRDNIFTSFTDRLGNVYTKSDLFFVSLNGEQVVEYVTSLASMSREKALTELIAANSLTAVQTTNFNITEDTYILAFYKTKKVGGGYEDVIEVVAYNYAYINYDRTSTYVIFTSELLFTDKSAQDLNIVANGDKYNLEIDDTSIITSKTDYLTGTKYTQTKYIVLSGSEFRLFADNVMNGFISAAKALENAILNNNYTAIADSLNVVAELSKDTKYYLVAYLEEVDNLGAIIQNSVKFVSMNFIEFVNTEVEFAAKVSTFANRLRFNISAIDTTLSDGNTKGTVSIIKERMKQSFIDYSTDRLIDDALLKYVYLTHNELNKLVEYYNQSRLAAGLKISYGSDSRIYRNISLEEALALVLYYYRNFANAQTYSLQAELSNSSGTRTIAEIISMYLPTSLYAISSYSYIFDTDPTKINAQDKVDDNVYNPCMVAFIVDADGVSINKVATNYLSIEVTLASGGTISSLKREAIEFKTLGLQA